MARQIPSVYDWARKVPEHGLRLAHLDLYVLKQHGDILDALGRERVTDRNIRRHVFNVLNVVIMFAPLTGLATFGGPVLAESTGMAFEADGLNGDMAVNVAMWSFIVALAGPVLVGYRWRKQRHWGTTEIGYLVVAIVCGGLTLLYMARDEGVALFAPIAPSTPVWLTIALASAMLLAIAATAQRHRLRVPNHFPIVKTANPQRAGELVEALAPRHRDILLENRARAVAKLRDRRLIDASQANRLDAMPLGTSITIDA